MSDKKKTKADKGHGETSSPDIGKTKKCSFEFAGGSVDAKVVADWLTIFDKDKASARIFHTAYLARDAEESRPVIFCMNGGPGASSVFLHFACCGPLGLARDQDGKLDAASRKLVVNPDSWLAFVDLVFIDPVGTGFSHLVDNEKASSPDGESKGETGAGKAADNRYWAVKKDLDAIGQFMRRFLREHKLWQRPVYFAGESYGGYRAGRLAKLLNKEYGVGMAGVLVISPLWEFRDISGSDYSTSQWVNQLPTYAAIAHRNGVGRFFDPGATMDAVLAGAEEFAISDYAQMLLAGDMMDAERRTEILAQTAAMIGLDTEFVRKASGRIQIEDFARKLREEHGEIIDVYDGSLCSLDPFPHRTSNEKAIEESLFNDDHLYQRAVHQWFLDELGVETDREYKVLNLEANKAWKNDEKRFDIFELPGAWDDFQAGMTANPQQRAMIVHGRFDSVTPYFASKRLLRQCNMAASARERIVEVLHDGGHMFYSWPEVSAAFSAQVEEFVKS